MDKNGTNIECPICHKTIFPSEIIYVWGNNSAPSCGVIAHGLCVMDNLRKAFLISSGAVVTTLCECGYKYPYSRKLTDEEEKRLKGLLGLEGEC